jgi:hypothetical protein
MDTVGGIIDTLRSAANYLIDTYTAVSSNNVDYEQFKTHGLAFINLFSSVGILNTSLIPDEITWTTNVLNYLTSQHTCYKDSLFVRYTQDQTLAQSRDLYEKAYEVCVPNTSDVILNKTLLPLSDFTVIKDKYIGTIALPYTGECGTQCNVT